uniref:Uncharacterized protein n=3 Tax=unclassified bacterial viruses TaxID=12333 RepID=A0AAU6W2Z4_9VIRU
MSNDKRREEFEAWARHDLGWEDDDFRLVDGDYYWGTTGEALRAWQASRKALVIELPASPYMPDSEPESMTGYELGEAQGRCDMWANVRAAIEAAGVKVKP